MFCDAKHYTLVSVQWFVLSIALHFASVQWFVLSFALHFASVQWFVLSIALHFTSVQWFVLSFALHFASAQWFALSFALHFASATYSRLEKAAVDLDSSRELPQLGIDALHLAIELVALTIQHIKIGGAVVEIELLCG